MSILRSGLTPFNDFEPIPWKPQVEGNQIKWTGDEVYSTTRQHGVRGKVVLHNVHDDINHDLEFLDTVLVEYRIGTHSYPIYRVRDMYSATHPFSEEGLGNLTGDLAERISRRVTKYFLKHISHLGDTGGIFDKRFNPAHKDGYIITNSDKYILKILKYPNIVLLKRRDDSVWAYDAIKELDGLFDYRSGKDRHILVLESKLDKLNVSSDKLVSNLFEPFKDLFPGAHFHYILFSSRHAIFDRIQKYKFLKPKAVEIYELLKSKGIGTLFFEFNERYDEFEDMAHHIITQYKRHANAAVQFKGTIKLDKDTLTLFDFGESPFLKLRKSDTPRYWEEID